MQTSRGKLDNLRRTPAEFTASDFDGYGLCYLLLTRPAGTASYSVSVRQVTALLYASLEPCLTATLLRFANTPPPSGCVEDFHLQVVKHVLGIQKRQAEQCILPVRPPVPAGTPRQGCGFQAHARM